MADLEKARQTQLDNIQKRTGKSLKQLHAVLKKSKLSKHGEMVSLLKKELGMGHGDANALATVYRQTADPTSAPPSKPGDALAQIYAGPKADLRPVHDKLMKAINKFGEFETAPKKAYVSLRRKKQFATIGPATKTRVEVGLNMKDVPATKRLLKEAPGGMCQYKVKITDVKEVDKELVAWIKLAYNSAA